MRTHSEVSLKAHTTHGRKCTHTHIQLHRCALSHKQLKIRSEQTLTASLSGQLQIGRIGIQSLAHCPVYHLVSTDSPPFGDPQRQAGDERADAAPYALPRSASGARRRWSPSPRSRTSQPAAGLCPAASARSARAPASRYMATSSRCCRVSIWDTLETGRCHHLPPAAMVL